MFGYFANAEKFVFRVISIVFVFALAACDSVDLPGAASGPKINTSKPVPVALLVPKGSGQSGDEILATSLENAARLAIADLGDVKVDLRIYATAGSPEVAASAATKAVDDGAKLIIGPVYAAAANAAGAAVAARNINVLSFSNNTDIAGGNVFILGNTFENTADRLVSYAVSQGKQKIMIVNGQDTAEEKGRAAIAAAIAKHGATAVNTASFELSQNGVVQAIPKITSGAKSSGADAMFFTSGTAGALPILTQLVTENGISNQTYKFIGLQRWDIPASAKELPTLQGGWFAMPSPSLTERFQARYAATYGDAPHPIASLAYDGVAAVGALIKTGNSDALTVSALTQPTGFAGVNGVFRLRPDGTIQRGLAVASIVERQISIVDPAPQAFAGGGS